MGAPRQAGRCPLPRRPPAPRHLPRRRSHPRSRWASVRPVARRAAPHRPAARTGIAFDRRSSARGGRERRDWRCRRRAGPGGGAGRSRASRRQARRGRTGEPEQTTARPGAASSSGESAAPARTVECGACVLRPQRRAMFRCAARSRTNHGDHRYQPGQEDDGERHPAGVCSTARGARAPRPGRRRDRSAPGH